MFVLRFYSPVNQKILLDKALSQPFLFILYKNINCKYLFTASDKALFSTLNFVCVDVLQPSQPNGVMSSMVSLPNHTFTGQA